MNLDKFNLECVNLEKAKKIYELAKTYFIPRLYHYGLKRLGFTISLINERIRKYLNIYKGIACCIFIEII